MFKIFISSLIAENIILTRFLGMCSFLGTTNKEKNAIGMGLSVSFVMISSTFITYLINKYILIPTNSTYLQTITYILVIACFVQITELVIKKYFKKLYKSLDIYLPLIATNCAVFGVVLLNSKMNYTLLESLVNTLGSALGFIIVTYIFAGNRCVLSKKEVPSAFKGVPIALVTAGIMALIFARLA